MRKIALLLLGAFLLFAQPAAAQSIAPPIGIAFDQIYLPDYALTVATWVQGGYIGKFVGAFERHNDGNWYGCRSNPVPRDDFDMIVIAAGGPDAYLDGQGGADLNKAFSACYPAIGGPPPINADMAYQVNSSLLNKHQIGLVGGVPQLTHRP